MLLPTGSSSSINIFQCGVIFWSDGVGGGILVLVVVVVVVVVGDYDVIM